MKFNGFVGQPITTRILEDDVRDIDTGNAAETQGNTRSDTTPKDTEVVEGYEYGSYSKSSQTPVQRTKDGLVVSRESVYVEKTDTNSRTFAVTDTIWGTKFATQRHRPHNGLPQNWSPHMLRRVENNGNTREDAPQSVPIQQVEEALEDQECAYFEKTNTSVKAFVVSDSRYGTQISRPSRFQIA